VAGGVSVTKGRFSILSTCLGPILRALQHSVTKIVEATRKAAMVIRAVECS
jgi:hypothetical protein